MYCSIRSSHSSVLVITYNNEDKMVYYPESESLPFPEQVPVFLFRSGSGYKVLPGKSLFYMGYYLIVGTLSLSYVTSSVSSRPSPGLNTRVVSVPGFFL